MNNPVYRVRVDREFPGDDDGLDLDSMGRIKVKQENNVTRLKKRVAELEEALRKATETKSDG